MLGVFCAAPVPVPGSKDYDVQQLQPGSLDTIDTVYNSPLCSCVGLLRSWRVARRGVESGVFQRRQDTSGSSVIERNNDTQQPGGDTVSRVR